MAKTTTNYNFQKPDDTDFYDIQVENDNWDKADDGLRELKEEKVTAAGGDIANTKVGALDPVTEEFPVPAAGESTKKFLGKVKKFASDFNDFKTGIVTLGKLVNHGQCTEAGYALDARFGKVLADGVAQLNSNLGVKTVTQANSNLNDYMATGTYYFNTLMTPQNIPVGSNGWLSVLDNSSGTAVKQMWYQVGTPNVSDFDTYIRTYIAGSWSGWVKMITNNDYESQSLVSKLFESPISLSCSGGTKSIKISTYLKDKTIGMVKGTEYTIGTLPEKYCPSRNLFFYLIGGRKTWEMQWYYVDLATSGVIKITPMQDVSENALNINVLYL